MALRSASQPNLMGSPPRRRSAVSRRLAPLSPQRGRRRAGGASSVEPRYIPGRSRLLETDHSLEDVSFRFPDEVDGELSASMGRPSLDAIGVASATVAKSLPPNKLAAFGDSSMSGITAIQNNRAEPYLHALRTMPSGGDGGPTASLSTSQSFRRDARAGARRPADTVRAFDEVRPCPPQPLGSAACRRCRGTCRC